MRDNVRGAFCPAVTPSGFAIKILLKSSAAHSGDLTCLAMIIRFYNNLEKQSSALIY